MTEANIDLGVCTCGEQANWYRISAPAVKKKDETRSSLSTIGLDDVTENLCDGCYKGFTGSMDEAVSGWKRVDVLKRQQTAGEDDQSGAYADEW
jgi:hypothetical protein